MRNLLTDADRDRLVAPLAGRLVGEVTLGGRPFRALAEREGGRLFPLAANAQAAELLLQPALRARHAALGDALLDFAMALAEAEPACRRAVRPHLDLRREDPRDFELLTPFFRFTGDLARGVVRQEPLAPGGPVLLHSGNLMEFAIGLRKSCADVEDAVAEVAIERQADGIVLRHTSRIRGAAGLVAASEVEAGTLEMAYEVRADSPLLRLRLRFTAARRLSGLRLTTALDALAAGGLGTGSARLLEGGAWREQPAPDAPGSLRLAGGARLAHLALGRLGFPAGSPVLHLRPHDPARVLSVTAQATEAGAIHWLLLRHGPADLEAGATLELVEDRLLAPGNEVAATAAAMAAATPGLDLDPAPPSGAALQAVARALMLDALGAWPERLKPARRDALAAFAARQLARIEADGTPEELGHALVAADALRRADAPGAAALQQRLAARVIGSADGQSATLAAGALALLGLARAATWPDGEAARRAIARILGTLPVVDAAAAPEALALLARATGAVLLAMEAGTALPGVAPDRVQALRRGAIMQLRPLVRAAGDGLVVGPPGVILPGAQALLTLALLGPDGDLLATAVPAPEAA